MSDTKRLVMLILLSFQTGKSEKWCEKFLESALIERCKHQRGDLIKKGKVELYNERVQRIDAYAEEIFSAFNM